MRPFCWLARPRLSAYQDGELSPETRRRVGAHLGRCEACRQELAGLGRLRTALVSDALDPPEAVWTAFWPQVRARLATEPPPPEPAWRRAWEVVTSRPRLTLAPAVAACALAVLAVVAPWQPRILHGPNPAVDGPGSQPAALDQVVIQSIETDDPDLPVMVYESPDSDATVLWVFGLEKTGT